MARKAKTKQQEGITYNVEEGGTVEILYGEQKYYVTVEEVPEVPWKSRPTRWDILRKLLEQKPVGAKLLLSGFPDLAEFNRAASAMAKVPNTRRYLDRESLRMVITRLAITVEEAPPDETAPTEENQPVDTTT